MIGDQSSGKSSTLESIAGIELPKGTGIITRNPLVLRMVRLTNPNEPEYAIISSGTYRHRIELDKIPQAIERYTIQLSGDTKNVTADEITLEVYKHDVNDLTLIGALLWWAL